MTNAPGDAARAMREENELEEGEMEEEDTRPATPSPVRTAVTTKVVAGGVECCEDTRPSQAAPSKHISSPVAAAFEGPGAAGASRGVSAAARSRQAGNGRPPPTAPRALREAQLKAHINVPSAPRTPHNAQPAPASARAKRGGEPSRDNDSRGLSDSPSDNGAHRNVSSTPSAQLNAQSAVGPAHAQRGDDDSRANDRRRHRPDSPSQDARSAKRHKKYMPEPQLIITSERDLEYGRMVYLVEEKQKRIDQLLWQLAEARAKLHIYKTRGLDQDDIDDGELRERITRKYFKIIDPEGTKSNWRLQELSDISDEESPRFARTRPMKRAHHSPARASPRPQRAAAPSVDEARTHHSLPCAPPPQRAQMPQEDELGAASDTDEAGIVTVGEPLAQAGSCFEDGDADVGEALADGDLIAGQQAAEALRDLSLTELRAQTAQVEYGLKFSYTLLLWQEPGSWLPAPLGRFGQPFWRGSSWEDFDPRRLFDKSRPDYVSLESQEFIYLARDASRIAFFHRSATQRQVVSLALRDSIGPASHEPDMLSLCRINPGRLPIAIRRQYRRSPAGAIFYAEYDAADVGCHIFVTLSGPQKSQDGHVLRDFREHKRTWLQLIETFILDWLPTFVERMPEPEEMAEAVQPWPVSVNLIKGKMTRDDLFSAMWRHLTTNGMPRPSMLAGGDLYEYMRSTRSAESERKRLSEEYDERMGDAEGANQEKKRRWVADRLSYEPVRSGFPVVRVKLSRDKVQTLAMRYKELGDRKKFIPLY